MGESDDEQEVFVYPTQKLGAITRCKNECTKYIDSNPILDVDQLGAFKDKLMQKIKNFNDACALLENTDADDEVLEEFNKWKISKQNGNDIYIKKLEVLILEQDEDHEEVENHDNKSESSFNTGFEEKSDSTSKILEELFKQQQLSQLPRNEPIKFSGDLTKFKGFMLSFKTLIENKCTTYQDKFYYLLAYTEGEANELVQSCHNADDKMSYISAMKLLNEHFGNEYRIAQQYLDKLEQWPDIKSEDAKAMSKFSTYLCSISNMMNSMSTLNQLNSIKEIKNLLMKLPFAMRAKFRSDVNKLMTENKPVNFKLFVDFVRQQSDLLSIPLLGDISDKKVSDHKFKQVRSKNFVISDSVEKQGKHCILCNKDNHSLEYCYRFKNMHYKDKKDFILKHRLCFCCLNSSDHQAKDCTNKLICRICKDSHPTVLHRNDKTKKSSDSNLTVPHDKSFNLRTSEDIKIVCPVIPVILKSMISGKSIKTYMALDSYSTSSYMNKDLLKYLNITGSTEKLDITTIENTSMSINVNKINDLEISSLDGRECIQLKEVYAKGNWTFTENDSPRETDIINITSFKKIPFQFIKSTIGLLIGMNEPELLKPLQIVESTKHGPYASRHRLGWAVNGPLKGGNSVHSCLKTHIQGKSELENKFNQCFNRDFEEVRGKKSLSIDEIEWLKYVESNCKKLNNGQFEIKLPFKGLPKMPNNYNQAYSRFMGLKRNLNKNDSLRIEYFDFMNTMIDRNFVERVPLNECESNERTWFLTHHGIRHKQKLKLRIVFDCSLPFKGVSLNSVLWKGPDLANNSVGVLLRFRLNGIAVTADVEKMYYNIKVPIEDRNYLRFFWFENDINSNVVQYRMTVHLFGATSSSSVANFSLLKSVENSEEKIVNIVKDSFYVDDMMSSFESEKEACYYTKKLQEGLMDSKFNLTSFCSNSKTVLNSIPVEKLSKNVQDIFSNNESLPTERALGIVWNAETDEMGYKIQLSDQPDTKRGILSTIFSIYDPLYLASPAFIRAKRLFQLTCFYKLDWDDELNAELKYSWHQWKKEILKLNNFKLKRCYKPKDWTKVNIQLHIFADGSEIAYGAVAYFLYTNYNGDKHTSLIISKVRLTPLDRSSLKTVPRIELNAAKVAVELYDKLLEELHKYVNIESFHFWTDSESTLRYINCETGNLQRFVANRVAYIRSLTNCINWRYVPSKLNPADMLSRGIHCVDDLKCDLWMNGPSFLTTDPKYWPDISVSELNDNDQELKKKSIVIKTKIISENCATDRLMNSTSSIEKLKYRIATMLRFKQFLMKLPMPKGKFSAQELKNAELEIFKRVQRDFLGNSYECLSADKSLSKTNPLAKFSPYLDNDKVIRLRGRLSEASVPYDSKHPIVLHGSAPLVKLIVQDIHNKLGHMGRDYMMTAIKKRFHIVKGSKLIKTILRNCVICRKIQGRGGEQLMADLPIDRVQGDKPPFHSTATDLFGPFYVKRGRGHAQEKRYGVVFSCLASRAFHLEITPGLDTDSYINALRRFISRRGTPETIRSDNGTNLTSANKELREALEEWNLKHVTDYCCQRGITWIFQPPHASHFGGIFERQIRTVRKILSSLLKEYSNLVKLTDDILSTLFCEIENIMNNRPLSAVVSEHGGNIPLTPNHLLRLQTDVDFSPGIFNSADIYCKRSWRQAQYLADIFWRRWKDEYLLSLNKRQKWLKKKRSLVVGDIVLVMDKSQPRNSWPMAVVTAVNVDKQGDVRSAHVTLPPTADGSKERELRRSIDQLILIIEVENL